MTVRRVCAHTQVLRVCAAAAALHAYGCGDQIYLGLIQEQYPRLHQSASLSDAEILYMTRKQCLLCRQKREIESEIMSLFHAVLLICDDRVGDL